MKAGWLLCLSSLLLASGCGSWGSGNNLPVSLNKDIERKHEIESQIQDNLQILLYVGYINNENIELANSALKTCLDIIGAPDEREREYASKMDLEEVDRVSRDTKFLLSEQVKVHKRLHQKQDKLANAYYKYSSSHHSLNTLRWFLGGTVAMLGLLCVLMFMFKKL